MGKDEYKITTETKKEGPGFVEHTKEKVKETGSRIKEAAHGAAKEVGLEEKTTGEKIKDNLTHAGEKIKHAFGGGDKEH